MRQFIIRIFILICLCANVSIVCAQKAPDASFIFYKAVELYEEGKYQEAINQYKVLEDAGNVSGALYYNIANAYVKAGQLGKAILYYERARRLIPRDPDVRANYQYARTLLPHTIPQEKKSLFERFNDFFFQYLTVNEQTVVWTFVYCLLILLLIVHRIVRLKKRYFISLLVILSVCLLVTSISLANKIQMISRQAVITTNSEEAKFAPFERATTHFTVYEGMKLSIVQQKDAWTKIERMDGNSGWVPSSALTRI